MAGSSNPVTVSLTGSGFNSSSIVVVSSQNLTPELINENTMQVVIPASFLAASATLGVNVFNRDKLLSSDQIAFYVYSPLPPVVTSIIPSGGVRGTTTPIHLVGENLAGATVSFSGTGITVVPQPIVTDVTVAVASDAPLGAQAITISTPSGSTTLCAGKPCTFSVIDSGTWTDIPVSPFEPGFAPGVMIRLLDGRVLIAGGIVFRPGIGPAIPVPSTWIFDPSTGQWSGTGSMNAASASTASSVGSLLADGRVLIARADSTAEIYNPSNGTWSTAGFMTEPAGGKALLLTNGKVLVQHASIDRFGADLFDPPTGRFQPAAGASFSVPAGPITMELLADGRVLIMGSGAVNRIYDPANGTLSSVPSMSMNGSAQRTRLLPDGRVLVTGGTIIGPSSGTSNAFLYDPRTNSAVAVPSARYIGGDEVLLSSGSLLINGAKTYRTSGGGFMTVSSPILYEPLTDRIFPQLPDISPVPATVLLEDGRVFGMGYWDDSQTNGTFAKIYTPVTSNNPQPVIGSVIASNPASNAESVSLDIHGVRFLPNSFVRLGQTKLVTLYLGSEHLVAFVPPALRSSLDAGIAVNNPGPGGGQTESVAVGFTATVPLPIPEVEMGPIRAGYVIVTPDANVSPPIATLTYGIVRDGIVQSQAAILPTPATTDTSAVIDVVEAIGRNTGVAIANTSSTVAQITLTLRHEDGVPVVPAVTFSIPARSQIARFVTELVPPVVIGRAFRGSVNVQSSIPISIIGLRFSGQEFSTVPFPTTATGSPGGPVVFPQFAISGGWATTIGLINNTAIGISGRVDIFDTSGNPMAVTLNGITNSTFAYSIPARGSLTLAPRDSNGQSPF